MITISKKYKDSAEKTVRDIRRRTRRPLDFIARLAALVPKPRVNLTRFHGVFVPNSKHRSQVTPARRGKRPTDEDTTPDQRHTAMTLAQRLKRVFNIDNETCRQCGGAVKVIACIQDPAVIDKHYTTQNCCSQQMQFVQGALVLLAGELPGRSDVLLHVF